MKTDETNLILDFENISKEIHPKRLKHILKKWYNKNWITESGDLTGEFSNIKDLVQNKEKYIENWDGRVVIVHFMEEIWHCGETAGILEDCRDNGWHLYTTKCCTGISLWSYFLDYYEFRGISYVELHPNPQKIWQRLNYLCWKNHKWADRFHKKIHWMTPGIVCDYSKASEGIFTYNHPNGKLGDCLPECQCKYLN